MKLLLDEIFSPRVVQELRKRGHDVVTVVENEGLRTAVDDVIFVAAVEQGRALVMENAPDFHQLLVFAI